MKGLTRSLRCRDLSDRFRAPLGSLRRRQRVGSAHSTRAGPVVQPRSELPTVERPVWDV